jgi:hypothetical protein
VTDAQKAAFLQYRRAWRRLQDAAREHDAKAHEFDTDAQVEDAHNRPLRATIKRNKAIEMRQAADDDRHAAAIAHHGAYVELTNPEPAQR